MELRQLRWFLATVQSGSISAAARDGPISQPAVSVAISQLERVCARPPAVGHHGRHSGPPNRAEPTRLGRWTSPLRFGLDWRRYPARSVPGDR
ncbi:helix-turn-helix domain-containing protein [Agromyces arachidis]|uniref:helix-turn-helix domain-containing protein n=1 Tax=Agromyces arachidis TaxID=766966 RepID=UPI004055CA23